MDNKDLLIRLQESNRAEDGFVRNTKSKALINIDTDAYLKYKQKRQEAYRFLEVNNEVKQLKSEVGEMKDMLAQILNSINRK